jgi:hypothetical protein
MAWRAPRVWVVIAAYNEAPVIASVVADVKRAGYRTVIVDDGSTDATGAVTAEAGGVVVRHPVNLGQGAGLQTGIEFALRDAADVIVTFPTSRSAADSSGRRTTNRCRAACYSRPRSSSRALQPD